MSEEGPDHLADDWAEIQESWTDALITYRKTSPELLQLMDESEFFKVMVWNVFANGYVRGKMAASKVTEK